MHTSYYHKNILCIKVKGKKGKRSKKETYDLIVNIDLVRALRRTERFNSVTKVVFFYKELTLVVKMQDRSAMKMAIAIFLAFPVF